MVKSLKEQLIELNKKIERKMANQEMESLTNMVTTLGKANVDKVVYQAYPNPMVYKRTYELQNSWKVNRYAPMLIGIASDRWDGDKYVSKVVETGQGYDYNSYVDNSYQEPRPFVKATRDEVLANGIHLIGFVDALQNAGFKVRIR